MRENPDRCFLTDLTDERKAHVVPLSFEGNRDSGSRTRAHDEPDERSLWSFQTEQEHKQFSEGEGGLGMAAAYQVTCIVPDSNDRDQRIDSLGGVGWRRPIDDAISDIEMKHREYWTLADGRHAAVIVAKRPNGRKYLKTTADGVEPNNLLALPRCS